MEGDQLFQQLRAAGQVLIAGVAQVDHHIALLEKEPLAGPVGVGGQHHPVKAGEGKLFHVIVIGGIVVLGVSDAGEAEKKEVTRRRPPISRTSI